MMNKSILVIVAGYSVLLDPDLADAFAAARYEGVSLAGKRLQGNVRDSPEAQRILLGTKSF